MGSSQKLKRHKILPLVLSFALVLGNVVLSPRPQLQKV